VVMALTGKNEILGTLYYMSPEQLQAQGTGSEIDARSDIFAFGWCCTNCSRASTPSRARRRPA